MQILKYRHHKGRQLLIHSMRPNKNLPFWNPTGFHLMSTQLSLVVWVNRIWGTRKRFYSSSSNKFTTYMLRPQMVRGRWLPTMLLHFVISNYCDGWASAPVSEQHQRLFAKCLHVSNYVWNAKNCDRRTSWTHSAPLTRQKIDESWTGVQTEYCRAKNVSNFLLGPLLPAI